MKVLLVILPLFTGITLHYQTFILYNIYVAGALGWVATRGEYTEPYTNLIQK